jgi:RNA polymerase sigma-70 factor (ECF subfamily)
MGDEKDDDFQTGEPADEESDDTLLERMRRGDERAARALFDRYAPLLYERADRKLPKRIQAKVSASDVVQDALLSAFLAVTRFTPRDKQAFKRWLLKLLGNRLTDAIRRYKAAMRDPNREEPYVARPDGDETPSRILMAREERAALEAAMDRLPADQGRVLRLLHFEGLTLGQAGERLDRTQDAARKLYSRALANLARLLGREGEGNRDGRRAR